MTCIVAYNHNGKIYMGGDSAGSSEDGATHQRKDEKVFLNNGFLIGFADSFRVGQTIKWMFKPPVFTGGDIHKFMVSKFTTELKKCLKKYDATEDFELLVAHSGHIFEITKDWQVGFIHDNYNSIGAGASLAIGAMYGLEYSGIDMTPEDKIIVALEAASKFNGFCSPPYVIKHL